MSAAPETAYKRITVSPIAGSLGAEIGGVDCTKPLDEEVFAEVHRAWLENIVIYFRDQDMDPDKQIAFAKQWGDIHLHAFNGPVDEDHPEITEISKTPESITGKCRRK